MKKFSHGNLEKKIGREMLLKINGTGYFLICEDEWNFFHSWKMKEFFIEVILFVFSNYSLNMKGEHVAKKFIRKIERS